MTGFPNREVLLKWAPLIVLIILMLFFTVLEPRFFSVRNFARIAISAAPALMVAIGVTFIILMGSIDLSMEGTVSVCAVSSPKTSWLSPTGAGSAGGDSGAQVFGRDVGHRLRGPGTRACASP